MDGQAGKLEEAAELLLPKLLELREAHVNPVVLIDGRSGSGKSTLASLLADLVFQELRQSPKVIHMDDLFEGWEGLEAGSLYLTEQILRPLRNRGRAEWQKWDWARECRGGKDPGNGWRFFEGENLLIVEGCGSVSESSKAFANLSLWIESDASTRKGWFLSRDGERFAEHWTGWSAQEEVFYAANNSDQLADFIVSN